MKENGYSSSSRVCSVCSNNVPEILPTLDGESCCPFCRSQPDDVDNGKPLTSLGPFTDLEVVPWDSDTVVYKAVRGSKKVLLSLVGAENRQYLSFKSLFDADYKDPYLTHAVPEYPNLIRSYPFEVVDRVFIGCIDYYEGDDLLTRLMNKEKLEVEDAVTILIHSLTITQALEEFSVSSSPIKQDSIYISRKGDLKIKAVDNGSFQPFTYSPRSQQRREMQRLKRKGMFDEEQMRRIRFGAFRPPECQSGHSLSDGDAITPTLNNIYNLGALMFEILLNEPMPQIDNSSGLVEDLTLTPLHQVRHDVPERLSEIVLKMTAVQPERRYQSYEEAIVELTSLNLMRDSIQFVQRPQTVTVGPRQDEREPWIARKEDCDFRRVRWGMTHAEVKKAEERKPVTANPNSLSYRIKAEGFRVSLSYGFRETKEKGQFVLCYANIQANSLSGNGFAIDEVPQHFEKEMQGFGDELAKIIEDTSISDLNEKIRRMVDASRLRREKILSDEFIDEKQRQLQNVKRDLDREGLESAYIWLKDLLKADFGEPKSEDAISKSKCESAERLYSEVNSENPDDCSDCIQTEWEDEKTIVTLSVMPLPLHNRNVMVQLESKDYIASLGAEVQDFLERMKGLEPDDP